jgi:DNA-binding LacI/PurR family transcriptional regulator
VPRRPTSTDVARLAGVSRTTVSFVLNDRRDVTISPETRDRVLLVARDLGYHANASARQLAGGSTRTLGLVMRQSPEHVASDALLPETLRGLASAARQEDFRVLVEPLPPEAGSYEALLRSQHVDGLVISGPRSDDAELTALAREGFPIILQGSLEGSAVPTVDIDNRAVAREAVEHLVGLGHRTIALVTNAPLAYTSAADRATGYREALDRAAIPFREELVVEGDFDAQSGHQAMRALLNRGDAPSAVFVASDVVAFGVYGALREAGLRVPLDVSVIGFDDIPLAGYADPPLTTVRLPAFELGQRTGRLLLSLIAGREVPHRSLLPAELVIRGSTSRPGKQLQRARKAPEAP